MALREGKPAGPQGAGAGAGIGGRADIGCGAGVGICGRVCGAKVACAAPALAPAPPRARRLTTSSVSCIGLRACTDTVTGLALIRLQACTGTVTGWR